MYLTVGTIKNFPCVPLVIAPQLEKKIEKKLVLLYPSCMSPNPIDRMGSVPIDCAAPSHRKSGFWDGAWKTHLVVALGFLLVGMGLALGLSVLYLALVVHLHPLVVTASSAFSIAAGSSLCHSDVPQKDSENPADPIGMRRPGFSCWTLATLQMLFSSQSFSDDLQHFITSPKYSTLTPAEQFYIKALDCNLTAHRKDLQNRAPISTVDPSTLIARHSLVSSEIANDPWNQHDPAALFQLLAPLAPSIEQQTVRPCQKKPLHPKTDNILEKIKRFFSEKFSTPAMNNQAQKEPKDISITEQPGACPHVWIDPPTKTPGSFETLLKAAFNIALVDDKGCPISTSTRATSSYPYLIIGINRILYSNNEALTKDTKSLPIPFRFDGTQIPQKNPPSAYQLTSFLVHNGNEVNWGHWICVVRKDDGKWFELDDEKVTALTLEKVQTLLNRGSYLMYESIY